MAKTGKVVAIHGSNITISANNLPPKDPNALLITLPASSKQSIDMAVQNMGQQVEYASIDGRLAIKPCPAGCSPETPQDGQASPNKKE